MNLYITADNIGTQTGGGKVTYHENNAFKSLSASRYQFSGTENLTEPFEIDKKKLEHIWSTVPLSTQGKKLAHFYAGTFTETIRFLKNRGFKITYTCAAHDINISRQEHEKLGLPFDYPHLNNKSLWERYVEGYRLADVVICPSKHSMDVCASYGCRNIQIIPHGVYIPKEIEPIPKRFVLGYLGAIGADKGIVYLLQAWNKLHYSDSLLTIAGYYSNSDYMKMLVYKHSGGAVNLAGWVSSPSDLYNSCTAYCQPSMTEGFGCEVLEAMAHGRPVICSTGAGAVDVVPKYYRFKAGDVDDLCEKIDFVKNLPNKENQCMQWVDKCRPYTWDKIEQKYISLWNNLLN